MSMNFAEALNKKIDDIEPVKVPPNGHYIWQVTGVPKFDEIKSPKGEWSTVNIPVRAVEPTDDVDADELAAYGKVNSITNRLSFMFDKNDDNNFLVTENRLKNFLWNHIKVSSEGDGMSMKEALNACVNQRFVGELRVAPDANNPEVLRVNLGTTAPLE